MAGPEPLAGVTESHGTLDVALQASVPRPPFEIPSDCGAGLPPPTDALKDRLVGLTTSTGATGAVP